MAELGKIEVIIQRDTDGSYIAYNDKVYAHGIGSTPNEAVQDYLDALEDMMIELSAGEMFLSDHLARELDYLREIFT